MNYRAWIFISILAMVSAADARTSQKCKGHKSLTAPTSHFSIQADKGVVRQGQLLWKRCAEGQQLIATGCENKATTFAYEDLNKVLKDNRRYAGMTGWRVPSIEELKGIVEKSCRGPAMNLEVFPNAPNLVLWSSTDAQGRDKMWTLYSSTGVAVKSRRASTAMVSLVKDLPQN